GFSVVAVEAHFLPGDSSVRLCPLRQQQLGEVERVHVAGRRGGAVVSIVRQAGPPHPRQRVEDRAPCVGHVRIRALLQQHGGQLVVRVDDRQGERRSRDGFISDGTVPARERLQDAIA